MFHFLLILLPLVTASDPRVKELCSALHPTRGIETVTIDNKIRIGEYHKCVFEKTNENKPFIDADDFVDVALDLFPASPNGDLYSCLEENGDLKQQSPLFYFNYVNCLVRGSVDGAEQFCLYRNSDAASYFDCLEEKVTDIEVPNEFKEQSIEYAFRVSDHAYNACKSSRNPTSFVNCIRQASKVKSNAVQHDCDIDFSQYDLRTLVDEEQKRIVGNGYKCVLNKLNVKDLPIIYPSLDLFYKKSIQTVTNCESRNTFTDDWIFYFKFAKCVEA